MVTYVPLLWWNRVADRLSRDLWKNQQSGNLSLNPSHISSRMHDDRMFRLNVAKASNNESLKEPPVSQNLTFSTALNAPVPTGFSPLRPRPPRRTPRRTPRSSEQILVCGNETSERAATGSWFDDCDVSLEEEELVSVWEQKQMFEPLDLKRVWRKHMTPTQINTQTSGQLLNSIYHIFILIHLHRPDPPPAKPVQPVKPDPTFTQD